MSLKDQHQSPVDLAEIFDRENKKSEKPIATFSARQTLSSGSRVKLDPKYLRIRQSLSEIMESQAEAESGIALLSGTGGDHLDPNAGVSASAQTAPKKLLLLPWGAQEPPLAYAEVNATSLEMLPKVQLAFDLVRVPIFDPGDPAPKDSRVSDEPMEQPFQVGTGAVSIVAKEGIYLTDIEWTDDGLKGLAEFSGFIPTVWLDGDLTTGSKTIVGVKSVTFSSSQNSLSMLDFPKLVNLSAAASFAAHERMTLAFDAQNAGVKDYKNAHDKASLVKLLACTGRARKPEGGTFTAEELNQLSTEHLKLLAANCAGIRFANVRK